MHPLNCTVKTFIFVSIYLYFEWTLKLFCLTRAETRERQQLKLVKFHTGNKWDEFIPRRRFPSRCCLASVNFRLFPYSLDMKTQHILISQLHICNDASRFGTQEVREGIKQTPVDVIKPDGLDDWGGGVRKCIKHVGRKKQRERRLGEGGGWGL